MSSANTETCSISAMAANGDALSKRREAVTALKVGTSSSPKTVSPNTSAIRVSTDADSGYALKVSSQTATRDSTPETTAEAVFVDGVMVQGWNPLGSKKIKLQLFDDIPKSQLTQERFNNLKAQYTKSLFEFIRAPPKPIKNTRNIAMTLEVLGKDRGDATPWVLIQCRKIIAKKVRSFFKQSNVEADFKPSEPTLYAPYLPILVHEESPESLARSDNLLDLSSFEDASISPGMMIYGDKLSLEETLCGLEITAEIHETIHTATVGGLVSVVSKDGKQSLFAITAGHFIAVDQYDEDEETDDTDAYSSDNEDSYELDLSSHPRNSLSLEQGSSNGGPGDVGQRGQLRWFGYRLGHIYKASQDDLQNRPNLDWAVIAVEDDLNCLPNIMLNEVALPSLGIAMTETKRKVTVTAARGRALSGSLSLEWSYLAIAPGNTMVRSYLLTFDSGQILNKGDSGAWVTDNETYEVYRHVVASDTFRRAHIIPINDTFSDIATRLSLSAIGLASANEIMSSLCMEQVADTYKHISGVDSGYSSRAHSKPHRRSSLETKLKFRNEDLCDGLNDLIED